MTDDNVTPEVAPVETTPAENTTEVKETMTGRPAETPVEEPKEGEEEVKAPENPNLVYPEGFDSETYDLTTQSIRQDVILEKIANANADTEKYKKQSQDMRKIISKGKSKDEASEYVEAYVPDEKYAGFYDFDNENNAPVKEAVESLSVLAQENGLNTEQFRAMTDFFNDTMATAGVLDTTSPEEKLQIQQDFLANENKKLHDDPVEAVNIINSAVKWVDDMSVFNEEEKSAIKDVMDKGAIGVSAVHKMRKLFGGNGQDIPTINVNNTGLASDDALADEYNKADTSMARRQEILQKRREAGRQGGLPNK